MLQWIQVWRFQSFVYCQLVFCERTLIAVYEQRRCPRQIQQRQRKKKREIKLDENKKENTNFKRGFFSADSAVFFLLPLIFYYYYLLFDVPFIVIRPTFVRIPMILIVIIEHQCRCSGQVHELTHFVGEISCCPRGWGWSSPMLITRS